MINDVKKNLNIIKMNPTGKDASNYMYGNAVWTRNVWPTIKPYVDATFTNSILDAGCGNGRRSAFFRSYVDKVTAVDVAEKQNMSYSVNYAKELEDIEFISGNYMEIKNRKFDVIYAEGFFYYAYMCYENLAFEQTLSLLNDGGFFIMVEGDWRNVHRDGPIYNLEKLAEDYGCSIEVDRKVDWGSGNNGLASVIKKKRNI